MDICIYIGTSSFLNIELKNTVEHEIILRIVKKYQMFIIKLILLTHCLFPLILSPNIIILLL